jgi:ribosome-associated heat shock protein Hsp15
VLPNSHAATPATLGPTAQDEPGSAVRRSIELVESTQARIDRWLWAARFFRTRSAAREAVLGGRVHLNGARVKPAKDVRAGDTVVVTVGGSRREVVVRAVAGARGPAAVAQTLYEETPDSIARRERQSLERRLARPLGAELGARPTKQDRRRLEALRRAERRRRG